MGVTRDHSTGPLGGGLRWSCADGCWMWSSDHFLLQADCYFFFGWHHFTFLSMCSAISFLQMFRSYVDVICFKLSFLRLLYMFSTNFLAFSSADSMLSKPKQGEYIIAEEEGNVPITGITPPKAVGN